MAQAVRVSADGRAEPDRDHRVSSDLNDEVDELAAHINARHGSRRLEADLSWSRAHHGVEDIFAGYRAANVCVVSSLHDGMNLVAKEFVAARDDRQGVLILSPFTGAAREMPEALLVNPYATDAFADALNAALTMPAEEQQRRMQRLRAQVAEHNIFRWAGLLLTETFRLAESTSVIHSCPITLDHGVIGNGRVLALVVAEHAHRLAVHAALRQRVGLRQAARRRERAARSRLHARLPRAFRRTWSTSSTRTCCARR